MDLLPISHHKQWNIALNLLRDDAVSEIEVNARDGFFLKRKGRREHIPAIRFDTDEEYADSIEPGLVPHIISFEDFDPQGYIFEGPLRYKVDGREIRGRCHIVLPPAADVPQVTIAKKSTSLSTLDAIANGGSMPSEVLAFVKAAAAADLTIVFSGGTGAGKTTFLEAFTKELSDSTRLGVAEDTPELVLVQPNTTYLHSVPWRPGMEERNVASLSWVVAQFNRMRTDKLIIGETRGKEFADFLVAANSGMDGSLTTLHANDPVRAIEKMTNFTLKGNPSQPVRAVNIDIANAIDLVIQLAYFKQDSRYRVTAVQEITNIVNEKESASITTNRLYKYNESEDTWTKEANPTDDMRKKFKDSGIEILNIAKSQPGSTLQGSGAAEATPINPGQGQSGGGVPRFGRPNTGGLPVRTI